MNYLSVKWDFHKSEPYARSVIWKRSGHGANGIMVSIKNESSTGLYFMWRTSTIF